MSYKQEGECTCIVLDALSRLVCRARVCVIMCYKLEGGRFKWGGRVQLSGNKGLSIALVEGRLPCWGKASRGRAEKSRLLPEILTEKISRIYSLRSSWPPSTFSQSPEHTYHETSSPLSCMGLPPTRLLPGWILGCCYQGDHHHNDCNHRHHHHQNHPVIVIITI